MSDVAEGLKRENRKVKMSAAATRTDSDANSESESISEISNTVSKMSSEVLQLKNLCVAIGARCSTGTGLCMDKHKLYSGLVAEVKARTREMNGE